MGSQGFRNIAGNPFVYQEDVRSSAIGLDASAQTFKIAVLSTTGALPTSTAQFVIDPATNGNVTVDPNGTGNFVITSGDLSLTAGGITLGNGKITNIYGQTVGATNGLVQIDNSNRLGSTNSPSVTGSIGAGTTVTAGTNLISTAGNLSLPASTTTIGQITMNSHRFIHAYGHATGGVQTNVFIGDTTGNLSAANSGYNVIVGEESATLLSNSGGGNSGGYNNALGGQTLAVATSAQFNTVFGNQGLKSLTTGYFNSVLCPWTGAYYLQTGNYNTIIGVSDNQNSGILYWGSGKAYTGSESSNICICNIGVTGESHVMRIGSSGTGVGQVSTCFLAGTYGVTPASATKNVAIIDSVGQLGSTSSLAQSYLTNGLTWNNSTSTPITAAVNNEYTINTASGLTTINLPSTFAVNDRIKIVGSGADGWTLVASSGDTIQFGSTPTSSGGSLSSTVRYDSVEVVCIVANTTWVVCSSMGSLTVA